MFFNHKYQSGATDINCPADTMHSIEEDEQGFDSAQVARLVPYLAAKLESPPPENTGQDDESHAQPPQRPSMLPGPPHDSTGSYLGSIRIICPRHFTAGLGVFAERSWERDSDFTLE